MESQFLITLRFTRFCERHIFLVIMFEFLTLQVFAATTIALSLSLQSVLQLAQAVDSMYYSCSL